MCFCAIGCQYSTLNRLFGCVFPVWCHHLRKVNKSSVRTLRRFFLHFSYCLMFLNTQIHLIILKTHDQQFTLTTKNSLHIIFKTLEVRLTPTLWFFRAGHPSTSWTSPSCSTRKCVRHLDDGCVVELPVSSGLNDSPSLTSCDRSMTPAKSTIVGARSIFRIISCVRQTRQTTV